MGGWLGKSLLKNLNDLSAKRPSSNKDIQSVEYESIVKEHRLQRKERQISLNQVENTVLTIVVSAVGTITGIESVYFQ